MLRLAEFVNGYPFRPDDLGVAGLPVVRIRQLLDPRAESDTAAIPDRPVFVDDGDLVFSWSATLAARLWHRGRALLNQHLFRVDPRPGVDRRWLRYVLDEAARRLEPLMHGSAMTHITIDMLRQVTVELPSTSEQQAIADYLDRETARIDALIEKKQRLAGVVIERFQAQRAAFTLGRGGRAFRESGIPWIGLIPREWNLVRLKMVGQMVSGHTPDRQKPEYWIDCHIPWVTLNDLSALKWQSHINEPKNKINSLGLANSSARILPSHTVIMSRDATVGRTALLGAPMAISQHFVGWICGRTLRPRYLLHLLRGPGKAWCDSVTAGATILTIGMPDLRQLTIPLPSPEEQDQIAEACEELTARTESVTDSISRQIDLFRERRSALITAAVSGLIPIPGAA